MSKHQKKDIPDYIAKEFPNQIKVGNNGLDYVSKKNKNNKYRWYKVKYMDQCSSPDQYYMQFPDNYLQKKFYKYNTLILEKKLNNIKKELLSKNIYLINIRWKNVYDYIDNAYYEALAYIKSIYLKDNKISNYEMLKSYNFIFYTQNNLFWYKHSGKLFLQWNLDRNSKKDAFEILYKYFQNKFIIPKDISKSIIIDTNN